jgi:hypothetical protein
MDRKHDGLRRGRKAGDDRGQALAVVDVLRSV